MATYCIDAGPLDPDSMAIASAFRTMSRDQKLRFLEIVRDLAKKSRRRQSGFQLIIGGKSQA